MGTHGHETFACPTCEVLFEVSEAQKAGLLKWGCTRCETAIDASAFT